MRRRPGFVESAEKPRALLAAFVEVPGPSAEGVRAEQLLLGFSHDIEFDALTLKGPTLTHIQRVGAARMMRVPVPSGSDDAIGGFRERLATFRRALTRQLEAERYDVVLCLDLFAAAVAAPLVRGAHLVVEVADVPSTSFSHRWPVDADDDETRRQWEAGERAALRQAKLLLVPSRQAGRALSERADPRLLRAAPRLVDTRIFQPPSMELALDDTRTIAIVGGCEGTRGVMLARQLTQLLQRLPDARYLLVGHPERVDVTVRAALVQRGLLERVTFVDAPTQQELLTTLHAADVVVVPAGADGDAWGIPHRVLEAMACERAVVVTGTPGAFKDAITHDLHALVVDADDADALALAARALAHDDERRRTLARAGRKQALRFDLVGRLPEIAAVLREATGLAFEAAVPPLDGDDTSAPMPRAPLPVVKAPPPIATSAEPSANVEAAAMPRPTVRARAAATQARPAFAAPAPARLPATARSSTTDARPGPPLPVALPPLAAPAVRPTAPAKTAPAGARTAPPATLPSGNAGGAARRPLPAAASLHVPSPASPGGLPGGLPGGADAWVGDTVIDAEGQLIPASHGDDEALVGLLRTASGLTPRPSLQTSAATTSPPASTTAEASAHTRTPHGAGLRSLAFTLDVLGGDDDWARDTIADASPLEPSKPPPTVEKSMSMLRPAPLLDDDEADQTAEDAAAGSEKSSRD